MSTIISIERPGRAPRHCDAHCYNAIRSRCNCICGGENHGIGLEKALQNNLHWTEEDKQRMMDAAETDHRPIISVKTDWISALADEFRRRVSRDGIKVFQKPPP